MPRSTHATGFVDAPLEIDGRVELRPAGVHPPHKLTQPALELEQLPAAGVRCHRCVRATVPVAAVPVAAASAASAAAIILTVLGRRGGRGGGGGGARGAAQQLPIARHAQADRDARVEERQLAHARAQHVRVVRRRLCKDGVVVQKSDLRRGERDEGWRVWNRQGRVVA
eukprot:305923-Chlamydomonas_euryale.AAC.1